MGRKAISTDKLAAPVGPFSAAVYAQDTLFCSGLVAQDPKSGKLITGDAGAQTAQIFNNAAFLLAAAGKTFDDVVKTTVYLTSMSDFAAMNAIYGAQFSAPFPARTTVAVAALPLAAMVEIEFVAR
jgi:2-iminobutanoate/2-iminopropanoate deaminase